MAREVVWTEETLEDLDSLAGFIARDAPSYASSFVRLILDASMSLNEFAERARVVPELGDPKIREILIREYRLIYAIEEKRVNILVLTHGARDLRNLWEEKNEK